jgi:hypothetical protein
MSLLRSWVLGGQQVTAVDLGRAGAGGCEYRPMTGNQLERFVRAYRTVTHADDAAARGAAAAGLELAGGRVHGRHGKAREEARRHQEQAQAA